MLHKRSKSYAAPYILGFLIIVLTIAATGMVIGLKDVAVSSSEKENSIIANQSARLSFVNDKFSKAKDVPMTKEDLEEGKTVELNAYESVSANYSLAFSDSFNDYDYKMRCSYVRMKSLNKEKGIVTKENFSYVNEYGEYSNVNIAVRNPEDSLDEYETFDNVIVKPGEALNFFVCKKYDSAKEFKNAAEKDNSWVFLPKENSSIVKWDVKVNKDLSPMSDKAP